MAYFLTKKHLSRRAVLRGGGEFGGRAPTIYFTVEDTF